MIAAALLLLAAQTALFTPHGEKAVVLVFIRSDCPVSNRYAPELQRLYREYSPKGVDFLLAYPEPGLTEAAMKAHVREYGYTMPAVLDPKHDYLERAGARVTPEAVVFVRGSVVYRGRIDDWYVDIGKSRTRAEQHDLDDVLAAVVAGKPPALRETHAIGCAIETLR
jgi:thiol-disulfide isomerase/thioredoxin